MGWVGVGGVLVCVSVVVVCLGGHLDPAQQEVQYILSQDGQLQCSLQDSTTSWKETGNYQS